MPEFKEVTDSLTRTARDVTYVVVGLGVLGLQRAQVRRQELMKRLAEPTGSLEERLGGVRGEIAKQVKAADEVFEQVIGRVEATWEPIEERLPAQARELSKQVRSLTHEAREQIRSIVLNKAA